MTRDGHPALPNHSNDAVLIPTWYTLTQPAKAERMPTDSSKN